VDIAPVHTVHKYFLSEYHSQTPITAAIELAESVRSDDINESIGWLQPRCGISHKALSPR
jgi:hypothetical protein